MKKFFAAIVLCLVCTVCFGESIVCLSDSTPIILPGCVCVNDTMTVFDLVPETANTIEVLQNGALYKSFSTLSCAYKFAIEEVGVYNVVVKNAYTSHTQKIIVLKKPETVEEVTIYAGDTYTWNDKTYNTTTTESITLTSVNGCDSIVTLKLTVLPAIPK